MRFPSFCSESFVSQSPLASACRTVNWYPEILGEVRGAKTDVVLYPTPGLAVYAAAAERPNRGAFSQDGECFFLIGGVLYQLTELTGTTGTLTNRGAVDSDDFPGTMTTNGSGGRQLALTSGNQLYIHDLDVPAGALVNVLAGASMVVMVDGRFIVLDPRTSTLKVSNLLNGLTGYGTLQSAQRDTASDPWKAIALSGGKEIWALGSETGDVWYDAGGFPMPFEVRQGLLIRPGIGAPFSLVEVNGAMMWLSHSKSGHGHIVRAEGYSPRIVSSEALNNAITTYEKNSRIDDAVAWSHQYMGHYFYIINFPTAGATWAYSDKTGWWHELGKYDGATGLYKAWGPQYHVHEFNHHLVGDFRSGTIYRMARDLYLDTDGDALRRLRITPGICIEKKRVYYDRLEIYLETGLGLVEGLGSNPQIMLRKSADGGKTFSNERARSAGTIGRYDARVEWHQLGSGRDTVFSVVASDPVPWRIIDCYIDIRVGR